MLNLTEKRALAQLISTNYINSIYMSKKSGKSKMITPTSDSKADSDFEEDTRQALAASREETLTPVTTNTDPSEAGPSNLEQTSSPAATESAMFGPPTLGDIVDQVLSSMRSDAPRRRELDMQGQKIVKSDTDAIPYTLEEFIRFFGNDEGGPVRTIVFLCIFSFL